MKSKLNYYGVDIYGLELSTCASNKTEARKFLKEQAKEQGIKLPNTFKIIKLD